MGIPTAFMAKLGKNLGISPYTALQTSLSHGKSVWICAAVCHRAVSAFQSMGCCRYTATCSLAVTFMVCQTLSEGGPEGF